MAAPGITTVTCEDFLDFQERLKVMRLIDDRITNKLNTAIPTQSFSRQIDAQKTCQTLYKELSEAHESREKVIKGCITQVSGSVSKLKRKSGDTEDMSLIKELRKEQTKLRMMQSELNVEEVLKERTMKTFQERCRLYYKPS